MHEHLYFNRKFKREKVKYQTDAEKEDWSYVFYTHVPKYKAVKLEEPVIEGEPWWIPVKHAKWSAVCIIM